MTRIEEIWRGKEIWKGGWCLLWQLCSCTPIQKKTHSCTGKHITCTDNSDLTLLASFRTPAYLTLLVSLALCQLEMETEVRDRSLKPFLAVNNESSTILVRFRPLQQRDRNEIKRLHEDWFPVQYTDEFYDVIVENQSLSGDPLYSCIAEKEDEEMGETSEFNDDAWKKLAQLLDIRDFGTELQCRSSSLTRRDQVPSPYQSLKASDTISCQNASIDHDHIVGCLIGCFFVASKKVNTTVSLLVRNPTLHPQLFYIMTLGTTKDVRQMGLASKLVIDLLGVLEKVPSCGVCYLHVITYNTAAIALYEKLGFLRVTEIKGEARYISFILCVIIF